MTFPEAKAQLTWTASQARAALADAHRRSDRLMRIPIVGPPIALVAFAVRAIRIERRLARQHRDVFDRFQASSRDSRRDPIDTQIPAR